MMGDVFPELRDRRSVIEAITREKKAASRDVLTRGMRMLDERWASVRISRDSRGRSHFRLYDTYGFPFDLTRVIATGNQFTVDEAGFEASHGGASATAPNSWARATWRWRRVSEHP